MPDAASCTRGGITSSIGQMRKLRPAEVKISPWVTWPDVAGWGPKLLESQFSILGLWECKMTTTNRREGGWAQP